MIDYNELERRVLEKLSLTTIDNNADVSSILRQTIQKEAVYVAIQVLVEYNKMKSQV